MFSIDDVIGMSVVIPQIPENRLEEWHTYEEWVELGRQVRKGQKGTRRNDNILFEIRQTCTIREVVKKAAQPSNSMAAHQAGWWRNNAARWGSKPPAF